MNDKKFFTVRELYELAKSADALDYPIALQGLRPVYSTSPEDWEPDTSCTVPLEAHSVAVRGVQEDHDVEDGLDEVGACLVLDLRYYF